MKILLLLILTITFSRTLYSGEVALTFDDAPMRDMKIFSGKERTSKLIDILKNHKIQTVFFTVTNNLKKIDGLERMKAYDSAGHFIANHTHTHPSYDNTTVHDYIENFNMAHNLLVQFQNFKPWFRYPYLRHGNTVAKRDEMRAHLDKMGYKNGYVTIDIQDWFMADLVNNSIGNGKKINKENLCRVYSDMIWDTMLYYDEKSIEILKRSPKHMLLLHENDLAAICLATLITKITANGWKIISPNIAIQDEIYNARPMTLFNNNGQISALYHEENGVMLNDPWSFPWEDGTLIREEFERRSVFEDK